MNSKLSMDLSVIICTYNRSENLRGTLESLERMDVPDEISWEVIVVDNNSQDQTREVLDLFSKSGRVRYVFEKKQGKTYALNTGIEHAKGEIIAFTDDDVQIDSQWVCNIKKVFDEYGCAGVGGKIIARWDFPKPDWLQTDGPNKLMDAIVQFDLGEKCCEMHKLPYGANMAFRRKMFEKYGVFRSDLGPRPGSKIYYEDTEFASRLRKGGEKLLYVPEAVVYHPVERERVKKSYYESWYYGYGGALARTDAFPPNTIYCFGIPRYLFRSLLRNLTLWVIAVESQKRFFNKLNVCLELGIIVEAFKLSRINKSKKQLEEPHRT